MGTAALADDQIPEDALIARYDTEVTTIKVTPEQVLAEANAAGEVVDATPTGVGVPAIKCSGKQVHWAAYNGFGVRMVSFFQKLSWCYNGTKITTQTSSAWGEVYQPLWSWKGVQSTTKVGGVGWSYYTLTRQGKFCLQVNNACYQEWWPWIKQKGTATGGYSYDAG
ncbi:hypothetical protein [Nonomuraea basaltis]|uniref:hypothetical protein n=1 Tax=Nonomuraea basaltis TaxID=2495887 RepID=UPI00110C67C0|nr:hypothetical protein [Nonomuraea basaltis]TMR91987.1 hypothetical protein EJK15_47065 [Nonomuraea basaltis]